MVSLCSWREDVWWSLIASCSCWPIFLSEAWPLSVYSWNWFPIAQRKFSSTILEIVIKKGMPHHLIDWVGLPLSYTWCRAQSDLASPLAVRGLKFCPLQFFEMFCHFEWRTQHILFFLSCHTMYCILPFFFKDWWIIFLGRTCWWCWYQGPVNTACTTGTSPVYKCWKRSLLRKRNCPCRHDGQHLADYSLQVNPCQCQMSCPVVRDWSCCFFPWKSAKHRNILSWPLLDSKHKYPICVVSLDILFQECMTFDAYNTLINTSFDRKLPHHPVKFASKVIMSYGI